MFCHCLVIWAGALWMAGDSLVTQDIWRFSSDRSMHAVDIFYGITHLSNLFIQSFVNSPLESTETMLAIWIFYLSFLPCASFFLKSIYCTHCQTNTGCMCQIDAWIPLWIQLQMAFCAYWFQHNWRNSVPQCLIVSTIEWESFDRPAEFRIVTYSRCWLSCIMWTG